MSNYKTNDPYFDSETGVFHNRLGITDPAELEHIEAAFAAVRAYEIEQSPDFLPGHFDLDHLQAVHRTLFGDVYPWAGEIRQVDLSKGNTLFAHASAIEGAARHLFGQLARDQHLKGLDSDEFSRRAGHYLGEINVLHPFREGNGRAQRSFVNLIAGTTGYHIAWENGRAFLRKRGLSPAFREAMTARVNIKY